MLDYLVINSFPIGTVMKALPNSETQSHHERNRMIITRTPFRLTLGGGGTDLPSFYREHGGFVLAVGIDKHMYLNVKPPIVDDLVRVQYTKLEIVDHVGEVKHTLAREALR